MPLDLFPYQEEGAKFLAQRERSGLFDEMGVGKTATSIRALDLRRAKRGIIIVPAMLRENWRSEFEKFAHIPRRICKGQNIHDFVAWSRGRYDTLITSYELATKWAPRIHDMCEPLEFLICDEAHYLKNPSAARTKAILGDKCDGNGGIAMWAEQAWLATGTPMANDPLDIYPFLRFSRVIEMGQSAFTTRYMKSFTSTYGTRTTPKEDMLPELQALIKGMSIRRMKGDIGVELPPIFMTTAVLDGDTQAIRDLLAQHPGLEQSIVDALERGGLSFLDAEYIATLRRLIGEAKALPYAYQLCDELDAGLDKRVVMGLHRRALTLVRDTLLAKGHYAVLVNGDTSEKDRIAAVAAFQTDPRCKVFIGNTRAAGVGLTLTAASTLDMLESDWTPAGNAQAVMRVHRLGQQRNVHARFFALARSFDEQVTRIVAQKTAAIAQIEGTKMAAAPLT